MESVLSASMNVATLRRRTAGVEIQSCGEGSEMVLTPSFSSFVLELVFFVYFVAHFHSCLKIPFFSSILIYFRLFSLALIWIIAIHFGLVSQLLLESCFQVTINTVSRANFIKSKLFIYNVT